MDNFWNYAILKFFSKLHDWAFRPVQFGRIFKISRVVLKNYYYFYTVLQFTLYNLQSVWFHSHFIPSHTTFYLCFTWSTYSISKQTRCLCVIYSQVGKLADLVLWNPALFGAKPEIVVKGGQIAWSQMGKNNFVLKFVFVHVLYYNIIF